LLLAFDSRRREVKVKTFKLLFGLYISEEFLYTEELLKLFG